MDTPRSMSVVTSLALLVGLAAAEVRGDAIVRTRAMHASTILEVSVNDRQAVAELEIGAGDLAAFVRLLPDELAQRAGDARPLAERFPEFFEHQRQKRYRARLDIRPVEDQWKLHDVEIREEERL